MKKSKMALTVIIIYTIINLWLIGSPLKIILDSPDKWMILFGLEQGGLIYLSIILGLFLNIYLILRLTNKD